ncbi:MAG: ABC transporter permease subunit [Euzebyales bacterium]|nr:ABC transporter permease subunit [Euzebyales bacterium]
MLLSPALLVVVVLYGGGVALAFSQSLGYLPFIGQREVSLGAYQRLIGDQAFQASLWLTLRLAITSTVVSAVLAIAGGMLIRGTRRGQRLSTFLFQFNLPMPHLVGAAAMLLLLSQSGLVSRLAFSLGIVDSASAFPALNNDRLGVAIMAEYIWKEVPFIGVVVLAALRGEVQPYEEAAQVLGATAWQRFRYVILPLLMPGVLSTCIIVFAFTFGSFEVPYLLGQPFPAVLPVLAYRQYTDVDLASRAEAMAISFVVALLVSVMVLVYLRLSSKQRRER